MSIKTITLLSSRQGYPGSTVINCNHIVKVFPKTFTNQDKKYQSIIIVTTLGTESECYRNCYDTKETESVIQKIGLHLSENGGANNMTIPAFCPEPIKG